MGWCRDFGSKIAADCGHPMQAGSDSCHCDVCGVVCTGRFEACPSVWALGPQPVVITLTPSTTSLEAPVPDAPDLDNGHHPAEPAPPAAPPAAAGNGDFLGADEAPKVATETGAEVFRWFQNAFDALRLEVEGLRGALAQEQAVVASLVQARADEPPLDVAALGEAVTAAVRGAVQEEAAGLKADLGASVESLRQEIEAVRRAHDDSLVAARALTEATTSANASLPAELSRRDSGNRKAFRATLREELQPLVEVVAESVAQSEYQLEALDRKLDKFRELGASVTAALEAMTESLEGLALDDVDADEPEPITHSTRSGLLGRAVGGVDASVTAARSAVSRAGTAGLRRPLPDRQGAGPEHRRPAGTRVSLRKPGAED